MANDLPLSLYKSSELKPIQFSSGRTTCSILVQTAMEAVGTAAAIIQLAGVGLTLAKTLYQVSDEISSAGK
ncbi:hypothetical protein N7467_002099 [Penicillium canescens]|nr:hypothetical protein N7467_002099 [Penicillium canescens]